ncbi:unnamed protein product [Ectocarpus sp. CCAP 1310/34]|nr:unnamed protein product [Ectocarpus sp. CCAP 1310/34]
MVAGGDLARVAKGAGIVAKALLQAEGAVAARQARQWKQHGSGLASSLKNAAALAVSSAQHQTPPPPQKTYGGATPATPAYGGTSVVETSTAASTNSVLDAAPNGVGPVAVQPTGGVGLPAATPPRLNASMSEPRVIEKEPTGAADNGVFLAESGRVSAMVPPPSRPAKVSAEKERNKADESGPWAFAHAASDSGERMGGGRGGGSSGADQQAAAGGGMSNSRARTVPSSPLARVFGFGQLAAGLAMGTVAEAVRQSVRGGGGPGDSAEGGGRGRADRSQGGGSVKQYVASDANAERLAETLCRMRGAALKLGQMLSIQDESVIPPSLAKALDRVRQGADVMPLKQLHRQLEKNLGMDWRSKLAAFDETPIAAASIGQVHRAKLPDGTDVAMKIQYPGVADSVESDLKNLQRLVQLTNILPPGLYIEEIIRVAREELGEECDYEREAANQERFKKLVGSDESLRKWVSVPTVVHELVSKEVLTTHLAPGVPVDQVLPMPQEVRNHVARLMLRCTINELFDWRFMQTDPNWGNFLFDRETGKMSLIDFGACREYRKGFVDDYLRLVWSAANQDEAEIMRVSQELKFLTGDETQMMMKAHLQAGLVVGEPFIDRDGEAFDFHGSNITARLSQHGDTFMKHRLTPPPQEAYSLHRKLAGAFLMNIKLKAVIPCRDILEDVHDRYTYG